MAKHELKVYPRFWQALSTGIKPFEVRRDDRNYRVGDTCELREYDPSHGFTGKGPYIREISYILRHEDMPVGVPIGYCVLGFAEVQNLKLAGYLTYDEKGGDEEFMRSSLTEADFEAGCTQKPVYFNDPS